MTVSCISLAMSQAFVESQMAFCVLQGICRGTVQCKNLRRRPCKLSALFIQVHLERGSQAICKPVRENGGPFFVQMDSIALKKALIEFTI